MAFFEDSTIFPVDAVIVTQKRRDSPMTDQFISTAPYFLVSDLDASVSYYHERLGFDNPDLWGVPPMFAMPSREGFIIMLRQAAADHDVVTNSSQGGAWDAYVWIRDAEALHTELVDRGATIEYGLTIQDEYNNKEFAIRDPDGHIIAFGQNIEA
jgi:catechol 2,3-dioxygenase-like lactoylglutathione lyase family enzyme